MLVLTRRKGEEIVLGEDIKITVLEVNSERVRIGIEAPRDMRILRMELQNEIKSVNCEATQANLEFLNNLGQVKDNQIERQIEPEKKD